MKTNSHRLPYVLGSLALLVLFVVSGCVRRTMPQPDTANRVTAYPSERAMIVHRSDGEQRLYYRDIDGKIYYLDQSGNHVVIEKTMRVERSNAGMYYILDDDNATYITNESGRLLYRDTSGRDIFIEEAGAGKVIDPLPFLSGGVYPRIEQTRSLEYCNNQWRIGSAKCHDASNRGNKRECLENCDYQREQCLRPY